MKNNRIWIAAILTVITVFGLTDCSIFDSKTEAKIEQAIEEGNFTKAKQLTKKLSRYEKFDMELKVCRAQVSSLIEKGEYELAADIAREDTDYGVYFNALLNKLTYIYNNNNQDLMMVVSTISFPEKNGSLHWNSDYYVSFRFDDLNNVYSQYNNALAQTMKFAKSKNDNVTVHQLVHYLRPLYKTEDEDNASNYAEANKIKKELGIK